MSRTDHWKLGLFVALGLGVGIAGVFFLGMQHFRRDAFPAVTYFDESVQGLDIGSPVKFRGVVLGTVSGITIGADHRHVEVWMQIFSDAERRMGLMVDKGINPDVRVQLASAGITGVKFLNLDFFDQNRYPYMTLPFEAADNYIPSVPSTLKGLEEALNEFLDKLPSYGEKIKRVLEEAREALAQLKQVAASVQDEHGPVQTLVKRVDGALGTVERAIKDAQIDQTSASFRASAESIAKATVSVSKASGSVDHAAGQIGGMGDQLEAAVVGLRETLEAVRALVANLDRDPSAVLRGKQADAPAEKKR